MSSYCVEGFCPFKDNRNPVGYPIYFEHVLGLFPGFEGSLGLKVMRKLGFRSMSWVYNKDLNAKLLRSFNDKEKKDLRSFVDNVIASYHKFNPAFNENYDYKIKDCSSPKELSTIESGLPFEEMFVCVTSLEDANCVVQKEFAIIADSSSPKDDPSITFDFLHFEELSPSLVSDLKSDEDTAMDHNTKIVSPKAPNLSGLDIDERVITLSSKYIASPKGTVKKNSKVNNSRTTKDLQSTWENVLQKTILNCRLASFVLRLDRIIV